MTTSNDHDAVMTLDEVAFMHRVSRRSVERWIAKGKLAKSTLPGGSVRIARVDAEALLTPTPSPSALAADQSSTVAVDSTEHKSPAPAAEPSVSSDAEDVPPAASASRSSEAVA
jgi:excisionase family DNA binding protein